MYKKSVILVLVIFSALFFPMAAYSAEGEPPPEEIETQSEYVGSATCARCHANTFETFRHTWHMNGLRPVDETIILGDFTRQDPSLIFDLDDVLWVIGGQYKQRYLTEVDGELFVLPAEWNVETGEWVAYEAENWRSRPYNRYCAGCHTTGYNAATQNWSEPGVRCEACHGPGADHVASTGNRAYIVNPADLDFQDQVEVCAQCHSRGEDPTGQFPFPVGYEPGGPAKLSETFILSTSLEDYWPDGTAKRHHMQYHDWAAGVHADSVSCIFCHNPHSIGETDHQTRMVGNDRCQVCHQEQTDLAAHIPFMAAAVDKVFCTDCHMPAVSKLVPTDFQILGHTFRPPNPALSVAYGGYEQMPNACNFCHEDKTPEWAVAVLGQVAPSAEATRVPPPTPQSVPTPVSVALGELDSGEIVSPPPSQSENQNLLLWGLGIAVLAAGLLGALWVRARMKPA